jgi:ubiquinone/menaquinone biosynthesis C-methylase UbiE
LDTSIEDHYGTGYERDRLFSGGQPTLEFVRSLELLNRLLPRAPASVLDVGGGPGAYASPLARGGYDVHLIDLLALHVQQAHQQALSNGDGRFGVVQGDARQLPIMAESQDAVLLMGPLYHLTDEEDRLKALAEASRVLRPEGRVIVTAISRFASLLDGLVEGWLDRPPYRTIVERDLAEGQHRNPDPVRVPEYFTTAYFHTPGDLVRDVQSLGFYDVTIFAVEGPAWPLHSEWRDSPQRREDILYAVRAVETEPSLMGYSHHLMAVGLKR